MKFVFLVLMVSVSCVAQANTLTVGDAVGIKERASTGSFSGRAEMNGLVFYLQGVVEGIVSYQKALERQGKITVFCPNDSSLSLNDIFNTLDKVDERKRNEPVYDVILNEFSAAYPCGED